MTPQVSAGGISCQDQQAGARPFLLHKPHLEKNNAALPPAWGKAHEVGGRKYVDFHRIGRLIRESLPRVLTKLDADQFDSLRIPACQRSASSDPLRQETPRMFSPLGSQRSFFSSTIHPQEGEVNRVGGCRVLRATASKCAIALCLNGGVHPR